MAVSRDRPSEEKVSSTGSEKKFRLRLHSAPEAIILITKHNRIVLADSPSLRMEEHEQKELMEISVPGGFQLAKAGAAESPDKAGGSFSIELAAVSSASEAVPAGIKAEPLKIIPSIGQENLVFSALKQSVEDALLAVTENGEISFLNAGAQKLYGFSEPDVLGKPVTMLIPGELRMEEQRSRGRIFSGEPGMIYDTVRLKADGTPVDVSVSLTPLRDVSGAIIGTLEIARDNSQRQSTERELVDQVAALTRSNQELEDYAAVVAHDLKAPLNMVTAYFNQLTHQYTKVIDTEALKLFKTATDGIQRMHRLIKGLLELARLDGQKTVPVRTDFGIMLSEVLSNLDFAIRESGAKITIGQMPTISADPNQLTQVFQNLISNAIKFRGNRIPEIRVESELRAGEWRFSVSDNGIGIEADKLPKLFQPLQRLHNGATYSGTGLGLNIARKILMRHGGRIWAESKPGEGSTFYFTLPAGEPENCEKTSKDSSNK